VVGAPSAEASSRFSDAVSLVRWSWPVGPPRDLVRAFEAPATPYSAGHRGIDIGAATGAPVRAPAAGVVSFAGTVVDRPVLSIQHSDGLVSSVEPVTAAVKAGERVSADQVVGVVAAGAHCSGRCVHFGVRRNGQYLNPMLFLGGVSRAVLLPLPAAG
jgi:murein DD-endopeptidase MepM/ murein hydrolase activator NlpD